MSGDKHSDTKIQNSGHSVSGELTILLDRWCQAKAQGNPVSPEELCRDSSHLLDPLKKELVALEQMDQLQEKLESELPVEPSDRESNSNAIASSLGQRKGVAVTGSKFDLESLHAYGGCSEVYLARDRQLGRTVAIKFLRPENTVNAQQRERLQREAEITSRLNHPGVVAVHALGNAEDDSPFYSMQYVEGRSLADVINALHSVQDQQYTSSFFYHANFRKLLTHFVAVCQTIAYAHESAVIHRDIKPANIVVGSFGETYVVDWGLAKEVDHSDSQPRSSAQPSVVPEAQLTQVDISLGTPAYMSPEQVDRKSPIGAASDIFNLGATLYACLVGQAPYADEDLTLLLKRAEIADYSTPATRIRAIPKSLDEICKKAMARNPEDRYASAKLLAEDIERFLADQPVSAQAEPWIDWTRRWISRHRTLVSSLIATALVALILLGIGNAWLLYFNQELAQREADAVRYQGETQVALDRATQSLYIQLIGLAHSEFRQNNIHRAAEILEQCPVEYRNWEWRLLNWMIHKHQPVQSLQTMGPQTKGLAVSRDGQVVVTASTSGIIRIWDTLTWKQVDQLHDNIRVHAIALSPDQSRLVVCGSRNEHAIIHLWELNSKKLLSERTGPANAITCADFSNDGLFVVTGETDGYIKVRNSHTLVPEHRFRKAHDDKVTSVSFEDNSRFFLSSGSDGRILRWNIASRNRQTIVHQSGVMNSVKQNDELIVCADAQGILRSISRDGTSDLIQFADRHSFNAHHDHALVCALSPDGTLLASGGLDRNVCLFDTRNGRELAKIQRHSSHVQNLAFDPGQRYLYSVGDDNQLNVWDLRSLQKQTPEARFAQYCGLDDRLVCATDRMISIWDSARHTLELRLTDHPAEITGLVAHSSDYFAALYRNGHVRIWNIHNGQMINEFGNQEYREANCAVFLDEGKKIAVGFQKGVVEIYDVLSGAKSERLNFKGIAYRIAHNALRNHLYIGQPGGSIAIHDLENLGLIKSIRAHETSILAIATNPKTGQLVSASHDGQIKAWNEEYDGTVFSMQSGASWLNCIAFTPGGSRLLSGNEHTVTVWDSVSGNEVLSFGVDRCVHEIAFNREASRLALASIPRPTDPNRGKGVPLRIYQTLESNRNAVRRSIPVPEPDDYSGN